MRKLIFELDDELYQRLMAFGRKRGLSKSSLCRYGLTAFIDQWEQENRKFEEQWGVKQDGC